MKTQKIILFTEHFDVRHVAEKIHLDRGGTLEFALNHHINQPVIVENSTIYRRVNGVYQKGKTEDIHALTASHIVMAYGPQESIGHPPNTVQKDILAVKYRLTGLTDGLIGDIPISKGYRYANDIETLKSLSRRHADERFIFLMNPRQGNGNDSFSKLFDRTLENPANLPWLLLNRTEDSVYAKSIVKQVH